MEKEVGKRGISPVVATVLLVAIVIVIALIIFLWFRNIGGETCTKFQGQNIQLVCSDTEFYADYNNGDLYISNTGNVPIFSINVRIDRGGDYETFEITDLSRPGFSSSWPSLGLNQGGVYTSGNVAADVNGADSITLTPILMGSCGSGGEKSYQCDSGQHGYEIPLF